MLWYYLLFGILALFVYAKLFVFRKVEDIDLQETLIFVILHSIMVFFMIMPVIFGAFGNFLLPTQLGVHDVAFPRLNSAAF